MNYKENQYLGKLCPKHEYENSGKSLRSKHNGGCYCCNKDKLDYLNKNADKLKIKTKCLYCGKEFKRHKSHIARSKHQFCSHSCSAFYTNPTRKKGHRVSKLEKWLIEQLPEIYKNIEFHFNRKDSINSELDIYIPSLKLAFELNGIFHYEPIYGKDQLDKIQNNDNRKFQACIERGIELCIIDVSKMTYTVPKKFKWVLDLICKIIDNRLVMP